MSRIGSAFADDPAFIPYLAAGDPDLERSIAFVEALERGGADLIELGLPFSEPIAEGPTIQAAVARALRAGMTPPRFFELVEALAVDVPLVCMTYYNLIHRFGDGAGPEAFVARAAEAGIDGFVVPDLPAEESGPLRRACDAHGRDLIFIVAPTTRGERLSVIEERVSGYVYVQARLGTTGARTSVSERTAESLARLRGWDVPKAVGFGISEAEHAAAVVEAGADGVIVGSALVDRIAAGLETEASTDAIARELEDRARDLKRGAVEGRARRTGSERT